MEREGVSARPSTRDQRCREEEGASERPDQKGGWRRTGLLGTRGAPGPEWGALPILGLPLPPLPGAESAPSYPPRPSPGSSRHDLWLGQAWRPWTDN